MPMSLSLPADVTYSKEQSTDGYAYSFRHETLGELGRVVVQERPDGQCQISGTVAGDQADPITDARLSIIQPITEQISDALQTELGPGVMAEPEIPPQLPGDQSIVESQRIPCDRCGKDAALLIFAAGASDIAGIEDYARKMYAHYAEINVSTWIIGAPLGVPSPTTPAQILKVWPEREPIVAMGADVFNVLLDEVLDSHC